MKIADIESRISVRIFSLTTRKLTAAARNQQCMDDLEARVTACTDSTWQTTP